MGRFRRRKPTVVWLPVSGTTNLANEVIAPILSGDIIVNANGGITTAITALTFDYDAELILQAAEVPSLADFEQSAYRLRRIVGKCFVSCKQETGEQGNTRPAAILVAAGFMVLRTNEQTGTPLSTVANQYSPLNEDNIRDPWIWRRSWILSNGLGGSPSQPQWGEMPFSNVEYGSVYDGPHIDQKTARVVGPEERLHFIVSVQSLDAATTDAAGHIRYVLDFRLLASMKRAAGNRRNASR